MARQRMLHPDFFTDADLLSLPFDRRLLFAGLWCYADRLGRLIDHPLDLRIRLFPADAVDVDAALTDLVRVGRIRRYEVAGRRYIQVVNFLRYQHPHRNEQASTIPPEVEPSPGPSLVRPETDHGPSKVEPRSDASTTMDRLTRAESVTVTESVTESVKLPRASALVGVAPTSEPPLREQLEADFADARGKPYAWTHTDDVAMGKLLGLAHGDWPEIRRRWRIALATGFPRCCGVADLSRHWNAYATDEPTRPRSAGAPVRAEAMNWSGVSSEVSDGF